MMKFQFPVIDKKLTGQCLRAECQKRKISVKDVQRLLNLGSPQTVYDWYLGKTLPSLDNMMALGKLLGCQVEELVVFARLGEQEAGRRFSD